MWRATAACRRKATRHLRSQPQYASAPCPPPVGHPPPLDTARNRRAARRRAPLCAAARHRTTLTLRYPLRGGPPRCTASLRRPPPICAADAPGPPPCAASCLCDNMEQSLEPTQDAHGQRQAVRGHKRAGRQSGGRDARARVRLNGATRCGRAPPPGRPPLRDAGRLPPLPSATRRRLPRPRNTCQLPPSTACDAPTSGAIG